MHTSSLQLTFNDINYRRGTIMMMGQEKIDRLWNLANHLNTWIDPARIMNMETTFEDVPNLVDMVKSVHPICTYHFGGCAMSHVFAMKDWFCEKHHADNDVDATTKKQKHICSTE